MAYAETTTIERRILNGARQRTYTTVETDASSAAEYSIRVPTIGRITYAAWELTTPGSSSTMRPTFRTATGAWDGAGANSNDDITRASAAAAQGQITTSYPYYAPGGLIYVRSQCDNAATDSTTELVIVIVEGHGG